MEKQTLNESQLLDALSAAMLSNDQVAINRLMSEDQTELKSPEAVVEEVPEVKPEETPPVVPEKTEAKVEEVKETKDGDKGKDAQPPAETKDEPEWVSKLPEEMKEAVLKEFNALAGHASSLEHYRKSTEGRVSGLQKKIDTLQRELDTRRQSPPPVKTTEAAPSTPTEDSPALARLKEEDPALYEIQKQEREDILKQAQKLVDKARAEFNSTLQEKLAPINSDRDKAYIREQEEYVLSKVPNALEVVESPHWAHFVENCSDKTKALINSTEGDDVLLAFDLYGAWLDRNFPRQVEQVKLPETTPETKVVVADTTKVEEERKRKLQAGAPQAKGQVTPNQLTDPEAIIEEAFQKRWKEMGYDRFNKQK